MKILSILNVSNRDNIGCDSGVIFHSLLFQECARRGHMVHVAAPFDTAIAGTQHVFHEPGTSKYDVRFRFEWDKYWELIEQTDPDVVFCHQVEQCASIRALLVTMGLSQRVRLVTYYHYLP
jgi:glycosyl transferase family 4